MADGEMFEPSDRGEWRAWLGANGASTAGIWLVLHKGGEAAPTYADAVEEAVAFGWIDSKSNTLDERRYKIWMTPRKPRSGWSTSNKERVARLTAQGRMDAAGLAAVEVAKANGSWEKLDAITALEIPADLHAALKANPVARGCFEAFPPSARRTILGWIASAKRPETRRRRVEETVRLAAENIRANQ